MAASSPASAFAVPLLLVAVLATIVGIAGAIPGKYFTNDRMSNQRLSVPLKGGILSPMQNVSICRQKCTDHPDCDAYAYSGFHKTCQIYKMDKSNTPVIQNMYTLYVREKTTDEGYYKHGSDYMYLVLKRMNVNDASKYCANDNGLLLAIVDDAMNINVTDILKNINVPSAIIGLTDKDEEGTWVNSLGVKNPYTNFYFTGTWNRLDRNCAYIRLDNNWAQMNCMDKLYFFCQYPMF